MDESYHSLLAAGIEKKYRQLEQDIMDDIVRRIRKAGTITDSADWQIQRLIILGNSTQDIEDLIRKAVDGNEAEVRRLYAEVIDREYTRDRGLYEQVGKEFTPYEQNPELQQITNALVDQSSEELYNITKSMGFMIDNGHGGKVFTPLADVYNGYLDQAITGMANGAYDYNTLIRRMVGQMTASGLRTDHAFSDGGNDYGIDYASGWHNRIDVAARRALLTGFGQLTGRVTDMNAQRLGTQYFEVTWHAGARPDHAVWQGKVYTKEQLTTKCGLGTGSGLLGWNCRHTYYPFIPGISERLYTDEWLAEQNAREATPKRFRGREYTTYEATQKQRQMETAMRARREQVQLLRDGGADPEDITTAQCKYQAQLDEYKRFSKAMGLPEQMERVYTGRTQGRIAPSPQTYAKWQAEQINRAKERQEKKRQADIRAAQRAASQNAPASGTIKRDPGVPASWKKGEPMTAQQAVTGTNPNFKLYTKEWTLNCQRCVSAFEARMRGYNVEARARILTGVDELPYMNARTGWLSVYNGATVTSVHKSTGKACRATIESEMQNWGDGARAIVRVRWKSGGGHVFNALQVDGQTVFVDPQSGSMDCSGYFAAGMIKPGMTELVRIDNLDFTDRIELCAKQKEE